MIRHMCHVLRFARNAVSSHASRACPGANSPQSCHPVGIVSGIVSGWGLFAGIVSPSCWHLCGLRTHCVWDCAKTLSIGGPNCANIVSPRTRNCVPGSEIVF